ncbi:putative secreted protein with PEP-CTERM sorting signal [Roseimicrobium gellanilyticum]|uniref:Putative secreted protein with PEP-CTERM sorting signal n=1 Tax=Roseimicrobium gellanilyticum TaxID=748857 RepID=A0A366H9Q0_9BACT|nr:autotransporter-associated beta strand repeat-containing protein [Roseimicrobium gellanilyticum]RBP38153.1 putative secreted protein with PEP-CTERM sorting signal [Roseimicrobium gellanilyticum]
MEKNIISHCGPRIGLPGLASAIVGACVLLLALQPAPAATATWNGTTDAVWGTTTNWNTSLVPGTGDTATFNNAGNGNTNIDLGAGIILNTLLFDTAGAGAYTIGSGAAGSQTLTLDNGGAITINATVTTSQLINAGLVLGNDGTAQLFSITNNSTTGGQLLTLAGGISGSTGAGIKTLAVAGAGNTLISGIISNGTTGTVALTKSDAGTLTLSGVNTYTGGVTLNGGRLNINNAAALGNTATGVLTINGGIINNTSGAAITTTTAKAQTWAGDFTFSGTNDLNFNSGVVTLTGSGSRTVNVSAGTLTVGRMTSVSTGLNVTGPGVLAITTTAASNIGGTLDVATGSTFRFNTGAAAGTTHDFIATGLTGGGTIGNGGGAIRWLFINNAVDNTFSGVLQNGGAAGLGLNKGGAGTLTLSGASTYTDRTTLNLGTIKVTGSINAGNTAGHILITPASGTTARMVVEGGSILVGGSFTGNAAFVVGNTTGGTAILDMTSGSITTGGTATLREIWVGRAGFGVANISGGTVTIGGYLVSGITTVGATGIWNINGGAVSIGTIGNFGATLGATANTTGVMNITAGSFTNTQTVGTASGIFVGENGLGILNVSGTGLATLGGSASSAGLTIGGNLGTAAGTGIVNLGAIGAGGGTIDAMRVRKGSGTATFNFHGGILKASTGAATAFMTGLTNAYVYSEGANIDTNGQTITIGQALLAPTDSGVSSISLAGTGFTTTGYTTAPLVTISGGTGSGATAVATIDASGNLAGITITNPGVYTVAPTTVTLSGGGYATTSVSTDAITTAANTSGGLAKNGAGSLTLTGQSTYTGGTIVNAGTLVLAGANNGTGTVRGALTINSGALVQATTVNAFGYNIGLGITTVNNLGGTLETTAAGDQGFNTTYNLTGATMTSNGGLSSAAATSYWVLGKMAGQSDAVNSFASAATSTIAGRLHLRNDNGNTSVVFTVEDGAAATDLLVYAAITQNAAVGITKTGAGTMSLSGVNTYTGVTTINAGTLHLDSAGALGGGGNITFTGGTLQHGINNAVDYSAKIINSTSAIRIDTNGQSVSYAAALAASNTGGLIKSGTGTLALGAPTLYTGGTNVSGGTLSISGLAGTATVSSGATMAGTGTIAGLLTLDSGSFLNMQNGAAGTLTLASGLTINGASTLGFDLGSAADLLALTSGVLNVSGVTTLNFADIGAVAGTYNLITGAAGISLSNFTSSVSTLGGFNLSLSILTGDTLAVTLSTSAPLSAYWKGDVNALWNTNNSGNTNWDSSQSGGTDAGALPQAATDVFFAANGAANLNTALGADTSIKSLTVSSTSSVGIAGGNSLTLAGAGGINQQSGAGALSITATTVMLGASQPWNNNSSNALTVGSNVTGLAASGTFTLTLGGSGSGSTNLSGVIANGSGGGNVALVANKTGGAVTLSGNSTYSGGTTLVAGTTLNLNNGGTSSSNSAIGTGTFLINGGTIDNTSGSALTLATNNVQEWNGDFTFTGSNALNLGTGTVNLGGNRILTITASTLTVGGDIRAGGGAFGITKTGAGTLVFSGTAANTYTGATTVNDGILRLGKTAGVNAIASTTLTIGDGVGSADTVQLLAANQIVDTTDVTIASSGIFDLNGNEETFDGLAATTATALVDNTAAIAATLAIGANNATTTFAGIIQNSGGGALSLTKLGTGVQTLTGSNTYTGTTTISAGTLQVGTGGTTGTLGTGNVTNNGTLTFNRSDAISFSSIISGTGALIKTGGGMLTLSGLNTYTGTTTVSAGTLLLTGAINAANTANVGQATVGNTANVNAVLSIEGGTLNASKNTSPSIAVGSVANSRGFVKMTSGTITTGSEFHLGRGTGAFAAMSLIDGSVTSASWFVVGFNNDRAILNQSGGNILLNSNRMTIGAGGSGSIGVYNASGTGTFTATSGSGGMHVGENGLGTLNVSGSASVNLATNGLTLGQLASGNGTVNLLGGTITTNRVNKGAGTGTFNFNGGTLKANATNATFMTGLTNAYVHAGGAKIDSGGSDITVSQALQAPSGSGVSSIAVIDGGSGYVDTPVVVLSGGSGSGATAIATVVNGVVTGFVITNPGTGYADGDVLTVTLHGGGATTAAMAGTISLAANTSGGLTKVGAGVLTFSGTSTYTGGTTVNEGTLALGHVTDTLVDSGAVTVNGGTLDVGVNSDTVGTVMLMSGTITGTTGVLTGSSYAVQSGTVSGTLGGSGALTKTTSGTVAITSANTYAGGTSVNAGTLRANNTAGSATGSGNVVVVSGGRLGGTGTVGLITSTQNITVNSGGVLEVGSPGDITAENLSVATSGAGTISLLGTLDFDIYDNLGGENSAESNDQLLLFSDTSIVLSGTLKVTDTTTFSATDWAAGDKWQLLDWSGVTEATKFTGGFTTLDLPSLDSGLSWITSTDASGFYIAVAVVPEPDRALLLLGGLALLVLRRRRP